jgi:hypothetical protein
MTSCRTEGIMGADRLGGDILAERRLTTEELTAALSSLLSLPPEKVVTYREWQELPEKPDRANVYCRFWHPQGGEFRTVIDLPDSLLHSLPRNPTASRLARLLGCRLLVCDNSVNPFSFLLYGCNGDCEPVSVDPEAMDRDEFVIYRE